MLCKLELKSMKMKAEKEQAEEQRKLDEIASLKFENIKERTISYCNTILNTEMKERAKAMESLCVRIKFAISIDRLGNRIACTLVPEVQRYANGDFSYRPNPDEPFDLDTMVTFLQKHCFSVELKKSFYNRYGLGSQDCLEMIIDAE